MRYHGQQKDKKSDAFTVKGGSGGVAAPSPASPQAPAGEATPAEEEGNANDLENSGAQDER